MTEAIGVATFSFELYPPRSEAAARELAVSLPTLAAAGPEFISVTYGANGSSRGASLQVLRDLIALEVPPMAHLTCVGSTLTEETAIIRQFLDSGITRFLALHGDPPADLPPGTEFLGDLRSASELVQLIHHVQRERVPFRQVDAPGSPHGKELRSGPDVTIAVAAFPTGHPHSRSFEQDLDTLLAKEAAGANLAITQLFFRADDYLGFVEKARAAGIGMRILPGVMPVLSVRQLHRAVELSAQDVPQNLLRALESSDTADDQRRAGIQFATKLSADVLAGGASGLHLYTFNHHEAVLAVLDGAGLLPSHDRRRTDSAPYADARFSHPPVADDPVGYSLKENV